MAHYLRFIVLHVILFAGLAALFVTGLLLKPFVGVSGWLCGGILALFTVGLICSLLQRWSDVSWIATHILRLGLLGTVIGLIMAFSAAGQGISSDPEVMKALISEVIHGMYVALYVTAIGVSTNLWLKVNLRLLGNLDE